MKKLSKFLSLALLTVSCCFSAQAKIDGKPATPAQHQNFINDMKAFATEYAQKNRNSNLMLADQNTNRLDQEQNMTMRTEHITHILYTVAIRQFKILNCRACASFALLEMEKRGIQCAYVQGHFDHGKGVRTRMRIPFPSLDDSWHDTVIYSVIDGAGTRKWYVCDMQLALHSACLELNGIGSGIYTEMRPRGTDFSYFFSIPLGQYIRNFAVFDSQDVIIVHKDENRNKVLNGSALYTLWSEAYAGQMSLYNQDIPKMISLFKNGALSFVVSPEFFSLTQWLNQAK